MRLQPIPAKELNAQQRELYRDMPEVIDAHFGELIARRSDGALLGPFNGWLHF